MQTNQLLENDLLKTRSAPQWKRIGFSSRNGMIIPLFSLRTKKSSGIGEYLDLLPLIDYFKEIHMEILQLLPINEMGEDFSPYNAISSCALDPLYISLSSLPDIPESISLKTFFNLNLKKTIHYKKVKKEKLLFLYSYYDSRYPSLEKDNVFQSFISETPWLKEYALFCILRKKNNFKKWSKWKEKSPSLELEKKLLEDKKEYFFYLFLQYLCFSQMQQVKNYAKEKKILLMGDIPFLINPDSVDVWSCQNCFDLSEVAGAPPDEYSKSGQKWNFPLFNWDYLKKTNYAWWKTRLNIATSFYDLYRIDHAVGFFRIWAIPHKEKPSHGHFVPKNSDLWGIQGCKLLSMMLQNCPLLPIAEDLGIIPPITYTVLKGLGIPGTKVPRWEKIGNHYKNPEEYDPLSITTLSTHDIEPLVLWWQTRKKEASLLAKQKGWKYASKLTFSQHKELLKDAHHTKSVFHINLINEYLTLFPELSFKPSYERINTPGIVKSTNWTYRTKTFLEEIITHEGLKEVFREIIDDAGRQN